jgi:DNA polymerase-3 subunit epsilon
MSAPEPSSETEQLEAAARLLAAHTDYRVLRRLAPGSEFAPAPEEPLARGVVVDAETTGMSAEYDQMIELGLLCFEYAPSSGTIVRIADSYDGLEDPGRPIPIEATAVNGITDQMVAGQRLDEARIAMLMAGCSIVIAHNAGFDRPFVEERLPLFAELPWADSLSEVPWTEEGYAGAKLEYLAWQTGFFYDAHRSLADCQALLEILRQPLRRSATSPLKRLLAGLDTRLYRLWALNSPFEAKDRLKERGYRWDGERRCWHRTLNREAAKLEAVWLRETIYGGHSVPVEVETVDARTRYSRRSGPTQIRPL